MTDRLPSSDLYELLYASLQSTNRRARRSATTASDKGQGTGATLTLGDALYVASWLSIFAALRRTTDKNNAKLNERMNGLF